MFPVWLHVLRAGQKQTCTSSLEVWVSTLRTRKRPCWSCCDFSDGPVVHVELVFQVPCGGSSATCDWRAHAFPSSAEIRCQPGYVHLAAASVVSQASYSVRVVLDRAFTASSGKYEAIQLPLPAASFEKTVDFVKRCLIWSNELCNQACGYGDSFFHDEVYAELASRAQRHGCLIDEEADKLACLVKPAAGFLELLRECGEAACENPSATYSTRGYFFNYLPCRTDLMTGFTREMVLKEGAPQPRPMTCSEFLCVSLMLGGLELDQDEEPYEVTPGRLAELCEPMGVGSVIPQPGVCGRRAK